MTYRITGEIDNVKYLLKGRYPWVKRIRCYEIADDDVNMLTKLRKLNRGEFQIIKVKEALSVQDEAARKRRKNELYSYNGQDAIYC